MQDKSPPPDEPTKEELFDTIIKCLGLLDDLQISQCLTMMSKSYKLNSFNAGMKYTMLRVRSKSHDEALRLTFHELHNMVQQIE